MHEHGIQSIYPALPVPYPPPTTTPQHHNAPQPQQPRAYIIVDLCTPLAQRDPAAAELLTRYFDHALAEQTYDALVAGTYVPAFVLVVVVGLLFIVCTYYSSEGPSDPPNTTYTHTCMPTYYHNTTQQTYPKQG